MAFSIECKTCLGQGQLKVITVILFHCRKGLVSSLAKRHAKGMNKITTIVVQDCAVSSYSATVSHVVLQQ